MKSKILLSFSFFTLSLHSHGLAQSKTETFEFLHEGKKLSGLLDLPVGKKPSSMVLIIPGYGRTNVVAGNGYAELRANFSKLGIAVCAWDKPGCGKSEGEFDIEQTVQSSADEALAAIQELKHRKTEGAESIGLWGISRAGWICPLIIQRYPPIAYWISVSGTDDKENFGYLLETNLRIEGRSEPQTQELLSEWRQGNDIFRRGGTFEEYQKATQHLRNDAFWISVTGEDYTPETFLRSQQKFIGEHHAFDPETGLMIYVADFEKTLEGIKCPVLALFGEMDGTVDWRKTLELYRSAMGARLTVKTFPDCNHNLKKCRTGGIRETNENMGKYQPPCDGYYETMAVWLKEKGFID